MGRMLPDFPAVTLGSDDVRLAINGRNVEGQITNPKSQLIRLLDEAGDLVGLGEPADTPGLLHPSVILR